MRAFLLTSVLVCLTGLTAWAQQLPAPEKQAKVVFENDEVRVLRLVYQPGDKSEVHSHPDNVVIPLTDSHVRVTSGDGKTREATRKAGDVRYDPALKHAVENIGDKPYESIIVELKCKSPEAKTESAAPEKHAKVVFENDQVRVLRYRDEPGDKSSMHHHPDYVHIFLTDAHRMATSPDGKTTEITGKAGDVRWNSALDHAIENTGDKAFESFLVEPKCKPGRS